jgi:predicted transcriptional regulator
MMWNGLPSIRKEIAESMINDYGLSQKETAEKLGITPAAVCQYLSRKRGRFDISDNVVLKEIKISANNIINKGDGNIISETCRICRLLRASGDFNLFCPGCDD